MYIALGNPFFSNLLLQQKIQYWCAMEPNLFSKVAYGDRVNNLEFLLIYSLCPGGGL